MGYSVHETDNEIEISITARNEGKFRFKRRENNFGFGEVFPTTKEPFSENSYLEWQISYDIPAKEAVSEGVRLSHRSFLASSGKEKCPYELSELFYVAAYKDLIKVKEVERLFKEIKNYREFIDENVISVREELKDIKLNGVLSFKETSIELPTLFMSNTQDGTQIEVAIKQQQYASGVQPMVYFCIPLRSFENCNEFLNRISLKNEALKYVLDSRNAQNLVSLMRIFGMASRKHQQDIIKIIEIILSEIHKEACR